LENTGILTIGKKEPPARTKGKKKRPERGEEKKPGFFRRFTTGGKKIALGDKRSLTKKQLKGKRKGLVICGGEGFHWKRSP